MIVLDEEVFFQQHSAPEYAMSSVFKLSSLHCIAYFKSFHLVISTEASSIYFNSNKYMCIKIKYKWSVTTRLFSNVIYDDHNKMHFTQLRLEKSFLKAHNLERYFHSKACIPPLSTPFCCVVATHDHSQDRGSQMGRAHRSPFHPVSFHYLHVM